MKAPALVAFALGSLLLVGVAVFEVVGTGAADAGDFDFDSDPRDQPPEGAAELARLLPEGVSLDMRGRTPRNSGVPPVFAAGGKAGNTEVTPSAARESFGNALAELDQILTDRRRVSDVEYREIYRWANDAYAGYSIHLDANVPEQRDVLEDAYGQLLERLGKLKGRVRKRKRGRGPRPTP